MFKPIFYTFEGRKGIPGVRKMTFVLVFRLDVKRLLVILS